MKNSKSLACVLALVALLSSYTFAAEPITVTIPFPPAPAGTPPALYPAPRFDWWFNRFEENINKLQAGPYEMIWDGDSITDNWQVPGKDVWAAHFSKIKTADFAIGGDQVQTVLWRVQHGELEGQDPKLIMLMIGTNNIGQDPKDVAAGIKMLIGEYEKRCPHAQILLLAVFPRAAKADDPARAWIAKVNGIISGYASDARVTYLDFGAQFLQPDGSLSQDMMGDYLHPGAKGYEIWANAITPIVSKYFPNLQGTATAPAAK